MSQQTQETQPNTAAIQTPAAAGLSFSAFGLDPLLMKGLEANKFTSPTEIQARSIPLALAGRDILASAQTGTGKTGSFVLPALQKLLTPSAVKGKGPRVLILTPTRELAGQVEAVIRQLGRFTRLNSGMVVGGVSYGPQERLLRNGVDLLVATPGRLMDHMAKGLVDFSRIEMFILDEADRMLDMGFLKPVETISNALPQQRQTFFFSATLDGAVGQVARKLLNNPEKIQLAHAKERHTSISQELHMAKGPDHKHALLAHFLADPEINRAIVFTGTKRGADKLAKRLSDDGHAATPLHGNMRQTARTRAVDALRHGKVKVLVATDVAARGIDVQGVSHVINYDLPTVAEDYIHRIGRTGRNGASGVAISLVGPQDRDKLSKIERLTGHRMERIALTELRAPIVATGKPAFIFDAEADRRPAYNPRPYRSNRDAVQHERPHGQRPRHEGQHEAGHAAGAQGQPSGGQGRSGYGQDQARPSRGPSNRPSGGQGRPSRPRSGNSRSYGTRG